MSRPRAIGGVEALLDGFDIFLVDQFGVLHDGTTPYPGAVEALRRLKAAGKAVVLLSNSGRRAAPNEARMASLGFSRDGYDRFISSGEVAWHLMAGGQLGLPLGAGARCLLLARGGDVSAIEGLGLERARSGEDADVILLAGSEGDRLTLDDYAALLSPAAARGVPCVCTNPDKIMLTPVGPRFSAGRIAELYESLGGKVSWIGKPHPEIYRFALERLGDPPRDHVVAIGDSVEHDIVGGSAAGLRTAFVRGGIHAQEEDDVLARLFDACGAVPDYVMPRFAWR